MIKLPFANTDQLAEALYYAYATATLTVYEGSDEIPRKRFWEELPGVQRMLWVATAARLIALHGVPDAAAPRDPPEAREFLPRRKR